MAKQSTNQYIPRKLCRYCGAAVSLKKNGTYRKHNFSKIPHFPACPGSEKTPEQANLLRKQADERNKQEEEKEDE